MWGGRFDYADQVTHELFDVAGATGDEALLLQAHHAAWPVRMLRGDFEVSREHVDKGLTIYDYEKHKHHASLYLGHDPAVCAHSLKAGITWALGFPDSANDLAAQALQHARRMGHAFTLAYGLFNVCLYHAARGDELAMRSTAGELWRLSNERQLVFTGAGAQVFGGWAMVKQGQTNAGIERMREGIATWDRLGQRMFRQAIHCLYAEALVAAREYTLAIDILNQGLALGDQTGERWWKSRAHLLHAQVVLEQGNSETAEALLHKSIGMARRQKAKSWELRATIHLSRLWAGRGRIDDAYGLLASIYGWFTEGFDTADLKEAKALLDELR